MACKDPPRHYPFPLLGLIIIFISFVVSYGASDSEILLKFKESLSNNAFMDDWNASKSPCTGHKGNWFGILCFNGTIWGLQLENKGLKGTIDVDSLMGLPHLRAISFKNNSLEGPLPDMKKLQGLKSLYLMDNSFSGEIPDDAFVGMKKLKKVHLERNKFSGKIPTSLVTLPKLLVVRMEGNQIEGRIPDFQQKELVLVNVSNNALVGPIPERLSDMDSSAFAGNKDLCGEPLDSCSSSSSSSTISSPRSSSSSSNSSSSYPIAIIVIAIGVALAVAGVIFLFLLPRQKKPQLARPPSRNSSKKVVISEGEQREHGGIPEFSGNSKKPEHGKLSFVRDDRERFDLHDLLKASAEVLGSGTFGSSYKATLLTGPVMVVKRYRQMNNVGREEFHEHMRRLGRLRHPNLLPLVAFYYRKEEKLLVSDFVEYGSLAYQLHGNRTADHPGMDWPTRLHIIKGVARGLGYLYNELPSLIVPHGHLKSSNVVVNESFEPLLTDYGLLPVINQEHATQFVVAYKSPEYAKSRRTTKKTDVWSLGILILEMLTGKYPANYLQLGSGNGRGSDADLASWVNSVVCEDSTGDVFDKDMGGTKNNESEMLKLLKIGLGCCEEEVEKRWDIKEAVEKIEELKERDNDDDFASCISGHSRAVTEDDISISMNS